MMSKGLEVFPFIKWAGGKRYLVKQIYRLFPKNFQLYCEPFLGSGALFFYLFSLGKIKRAYLSDINTDLILTYIGVRDYVEEVIKHLKEMPVTKEFYYYLRALDPRKLSIPERAARFIYLNKTCYNGLYRVNKEGKFNVPFGRYKNPKIFDEENLRKASYALSFAEITTSDFRTVEHILNFEDLVYFDPPYHLTYDSYHKDGFTEEDQRDLEDLALSLTKKGVYVIISNSDTEFIKTLYQKFIIYTIKGFRFICCDKNKRGKVKELLITNIPLLTKKDSYIEHFFENRNLFDFRS